MKLNDRLVFHRFKKRSIHRMKKKIMKFFNRSTKKEKELEE